MTLALFSLLVALGSFAGGLLGALTGPRGGIIVVPLLTLGLGVNLRHAIAAASAGVYLHRGQIDPYLAFPVMLGVLAGALLGARILTRARTTWLRRLFTAVVVILALQMLYKGITGGV